MFILERDIKDRQLKVRSRRKKHSSMRGFHIFLQLKLTMSVRHLEMLQISIRLLLRMTIVSQYHLAKHSFDLWP